jgi:hypothetical protein
MDRAGERKNAATWLDDGVRVGFYNIAASIIENDGWSIGRV